MKSSETQIKLDQERKGRKTRKQKSKNIRKNSNKAKKRKLSNENEVLFKVPNLKTIPPGCQHLVNPGDIVYVVPGDGACCPNCAAAFFFHDEVFGPKLRRKMNEFFVKHYQKKYKDICPCSDETPFVRNTSSGEVTYTDPEELFKFLMSGDKKSDYMWSDSVDLVVIADMYQVNIKVITVKGSTDMNPTVNWFYPDKNMEQFAELRNVEQNDMILLHEDDSHYNLIISKDSDLAKLGSLSFRFNVGPLVNNATGESDKDTKEEIGKCNETEEAENVDQNESELAKLKIEFKKCKESRDAFEKEYFKCEKELRIKTEETEKLKLEIKDLRKIVKLRKEIKDKKLDIETEESVDELKIVSDNKKKGFGRESPSTESVKRPDQNLDQIKTKEFNCKKCVFSASNRFQLNKHINLKHAEIGKTELNSGHNEEDFNCVECDFQCSSKMQLRKHKSLKHMIRSELDNEQLKCRYCDEVFSLKWNLMVHRKNNHEGTVAICRNYADGNCSFTAEACWWVHERRANNEEKIQCFICSEIFNNKSNLMSHRKQKHSNFVQMCTKFSNKSCRFQEDFCWYRHKTEKDEIACEVEEKETDTTPVFQKGIKNPKPPSKIQGERQKQEEMSN